ncbi:hypothetical protein SDC9_190028 [bioreactor metagenome]|uniref:Uncharacterized protein n=1 Tax=bioreactor metagenome TaxID=1076179 RepID=A0A645HTU9_9ZZZZ
MLFNIEITMFEQINTAVAEIPIPMPFMILDVVARVGQVPSNKINVGFSLIIPFVTIPSLLIILHLLRLQTVLKHLEQNGKYHLRKW